MDVDDCISDSVGPVPGPKGSWLFGSLHEFQNDALGFLTDSVQRYGDVVRFRFGYVVAYLINRPEYVEQVLVRESRNFDKNTRSVAKLRATCGNSLLSSDGKPWLRHRRLIQPVFQPQKIATFQPAIDAAMESMIESWRSSVATGNSIDIVSEMTTLTMSIAATAFFGSDIREQTAAIEQALGSILQDTWRRLESPVDLAILSPWLHRPAFRTALRKIDAIVYQIIDARRQLDCPPDDLLSRLLQAHESDGEMRLGDQELRDAVVTLLLAGHETTANALVSAFSLISLNTDVEQRLIAAADQSRHSAAASADLLTEARNCFSETVRLAPSIWIIERHALVDSKIGGYRIPKGSTVILSPYLLHRHPEFWPEPNCFDPSRFESERSKDHSRCAYLPFGSGPHRCIGEHMAMRVGTQVIASIYRHFRLRLKTGQPSAPVPGITLRYTHPVWMDVQECHGR